MVQIWNVLSTELVESQSVKSFQSALTKFAKTACEGEAPNWPRMYSVDSLPHALILQYCFA